MLTAGAAALSTATLLLHRGVRGADHSERAEQLQPEGMTKKATVDYVIDGLRVNPRINPRCLLHQRERVPQKATFVYVTYGGVYYTREKG